MVTCAANKPVVKFERLPTFAEPIHYDLHIAPNLNTFIFHGFVSIDVKIKESTGMLKLHAHSLKFQSISIVDASGKVYHSLPAFYNGQLSILTIQLPEVFEPQNIKLDMKYSAELSDKMSGFYKSSYKDSKGELKFLATTFLDPTNARMAFPCWDEPIYKATFDVTLEVAVGLTAISNTNEISSKTTEDGRRKLVKFATTPKMSSYLIAFVVGELEYIRAETKSGVEVRVYTVPGKSSQGQFSLDLGCKAIDWYNEWFDIPYPLPKCDFVAVPDFSMGAMENWGLITFREVALLVDSAVTSTYRKSRIGLIVAHELAHMWFGNLVTMKWWTDLWLKEGFASFMEYLFVGANYPEFRIWLHFLNDELASGMELDSLRNSHPIEVEINNPDELQEIYDSITYAKSNSVNRMLCFYLSEPVFQKGLRIYLKKFQYSNADTQDLWAALSEASGQNVSKLMSGWTQQMGFPVVNVSQRQDGKNRVLTLEQNRFIKDGGEDSVGSSWQVPITLSVGSDPNSVKDKFVLKKKKQKVAVKNVAPEEWVKLNAESIGFYRVEYSDEMLQAMLPDIASKRMNVLDRFGIMSDLSALVSSGRVPIAKFIDVAATLASEDEYIVWSAIDEGLNKLLLCTRNMSDETHKRAKQLIAKLFRQIGERLGFSEQAGDDSQTMMLRSSVQAKLALVENEPTVEKLVSLFNDYVEKGIALHPDIRLTVFSTVSRQGDAEMFDKLIKIREETTFSEIDRQCLIAMSQTPDQSLLARLFDYGFKLNKVRAQDHLCLFIGSSSSKMAEEYVWKYFTENIGEFLKKYGGATSGNFQNCLKYATCGSATEERAVVVEKLFRESKSLTDKDRQVLDRPIKQCVEAIRSNAFLLETNRASIENLLNRHDL